MVNAPAGRPVKAYDPALSVTVVSAAGPLRMTVRPGRVGSMISFVPFSFWSS